MSDVPRTVEWTEPGCANCGRATTQRCPNCNHILVCSPTCADALQTEHASDCIDLQRTLDLFHRTGLDPPGGFGMVLEVPVDRYLALVALTADLRRRHNDTEQRLHRGDATLPLASKLAYYLDFLHAYDTSSSENASRPSVDKMWLNRKYNTLLLDAEDRLSFHEHQVLSRERLRRRIGADSKELNP